MEDNILISHLYQDDKEDRWVIQTNDEHQRGVAEKAASFAREIGLSTWGYALGMLHDKGKERKAFQQYIRSVNGIAVADKTVYKEHHHAYVGGLLASHLMGKAVKDLLVNPIISHHTGLHDYTEVEKIMDTGVVPEEIKVGEAKLEKSRLVNELRESPFVRLNLPMTDFHHLPRMLFSCLVDADWLDTEQFMDINSWRKRGQYSSIADLLPRLEDYILQLQSSAPASTVNRIRADVMEQCKKMSSEAPGFYSLTVPTGGGKTLSSLMWAMRHAVTHHQHRIIIAIPYTSIITQTAQLLKKIFGEENVLEHHSCFNPDSIRNVEIRERVKLATENWDYPIIVTTNVQLFESIFSHKTSVCRKLHHIANSVIILDEVQTLPTDFLQPIVDAMKAYQRMFGVSFLFTTASQPVLSGLIKGANPRLEFYGIEHITEIIPTEFRLHDKLRRVRLIMNNSPQTYDEIAGKLSQYHKVLCIVNTRQDAKELFDRLPDDGVKLHLSRMMCPAHIGQTICKIKQSLLDESIPIVRVIATQLVEAGVDMDFPVVFRQEAGLDSLLQAAGRCNREGKLQFGETFVFSLAGEKRIPFGEMAAANNARLSLPDESDWFSPSTMKDYFRQLYFRKETFDKKDIKHYLYKQNELCFEQASAAFKLIEDEGAHVIVNWKDSMNLVDELKRTGCTYSLMRQLSMFTVNIHQKDFQKLIQIGPVEEVLEGIYVLRDKTQYNEYTGLSLDNHWLEEILMV